MKEQPTPKTFFHKVGGYYLIPHELLHVLAYRLIGKPYDYQWGDYQVSSPAKMTQGERLFVLLLPLGVCLTLSFFFHFVWIILALSAQLPLAEYLLAAPKWHFVFHILANLCMLYTGTSYRDIRRILHLLFGQKEPKQKSYQPH
jgi:hypothetical protein